MVCEWSLTSRWGRGANHRDAGDKRAGLPAMGTSRAVGLLAMGALAAGTKGAGGCNAAGHGDASHWGLRDRWRAEHNLTKLYLAAQL